MKFVVLGTSEFTLRCAQGLKSGGGTLAALISMPRSMRPDNSANVAEFARRAGVPYHEVGDINGPKALRLLRALKPDVIFSSWPRLLKKQVLMIPRAGCVGSHPTALPFNRGRHPLHWLIVLGIQETKLSFFRMDAGVDTGDVLLQKPFRLSPGGGIGDAAARMNRAAVEGTRLLCRRLMGDPAWRGERQDHRLANTWRRRTPHDVTLDLRLTVEALVRIVRSFAPPYPGANLIFKDRVLKVVDAAAAPAGMTAARLKRVEPGRILSSSGRTLRVKAMDGVVRLTLAGSVPPMLRAAAHIHPPTRYAADFPGVLRALG